MVTEMHCFEIFAFEKYFDLETLFRVNVTFNDTIRKYQARYIVTLVLACTVSEL